MLDTKNLAKQYIFPFHTSSVTIRSAAARVQMQEHALHNSKILAREHALVYGIYLHKYLLPA